MGVVGATQAMTATVVRSVTCGVHPTTSQQQGLLTAMDRVGDRHGYAFSRAAVFAQPFDRQLLEHAIAGVVAEHTALSTRIDTSTEPPTQLVAPAYRPSVSWRAARTADELFAGSVAIEDVPLTQLNIVEFAHRELLVLRTHHIVCDDWSWGVLLSDLSARYAGHAPEPPPLRYSDYARWQARSVDPGRYAEHVKYWGALIGDRRSVGVPLEGWHVRDLAASSVAFNVDDATCDACAQASRRLGVRPFRVLLAAFHAAVARETGCDDTVIASATANRQQPETRRIVGFLANGRLTRLRHRARTLADLVVQLDRQWQEGDRHADAHLEKLVLDLGAPSLGNVKFSLQDALSRVEVSQPRALFEKTLDPPCGSSSRRDLDLRLAPVDGGLLGTAIFRRACLKEADVTVLIDVWLGLIHSLGDT